MMRKTLLLLPMIVLLAACTTPASPPTQSAMVKVFFAGPEGSVKTALSLAANFQPVTDPSQADVLVLQGAILDPQGYGAWLRAGKGAVIFLGTGTTPEAFKTLTAVPVALQSVDTPLSLVEAPGAQSSLLSDILWNSAPQIRQRYDVPTPFSSVTPLVVGYEDGSWALWQARERVFVFDAFLGEENPQFQEWAYFNYLIYHLVMDAAGKPALSFADYPASPVPHALEQGALLTVTLLLVVSSFAVFAWVRRYSLAHPEALDTLVADRQAFERHEAKTDWEAVGFHRPLGGFLVALGMGLVLFIPLIIYQNLILPGYILPSAQALGIWGRVTQFFNLAWFFFDMGTSVAFIKYLAEYRVSDPRKGIQYGQVFVWWQMLSGAVQVALVIGIASIVGPRSAYALYVWSVIIHSFIQIPGFYQVMKHALTGLQRLDYSRLLEIGLNVVLPVLVQPIFVTLMFAWGKAHPVFGGAMGGVLGLGIAAYAAEVFAFLLGWWLYRRIGYSARVLFLAHFDWEVVKTSFRFGVFEMLGSAAWSFGQAAEIAITQGRLINYAEIWGNWGLAQNFIFAFNATQTLNDGIMPAISEAFSHGKRLLSQYYSVMAYKYNATVSAFIGAVLLAVAPRFILGSLGNEFERAASYAVPLIIWGTIQFPSWVGDIVQLGANKPYLKSILVFAEQIIRVMLAWALLERFQVTGLIIAYFVGLFAKGISAYLINHRLCFPQRFYFWQSLAAPLLAAAAHWAVLQWLSGLIWQGDQITSVLIFFIGILPSFPLYLFFYGLFGGWDDATLGELKNAVALSGFMRPLAWLFWAATALGARLSPLHNRFPITIRQAALEEAKALTQKRAQV